MELAIITLSLLGITVASFLVGSFWLAKYAFRLGAGPGLGVLLFPPYTFYFAFYQLDQDSKDRPTALWMFGLVASILLVLIFASVLRVPYFVEPTPIDQSVITGSAGDEITFEAAIFDLDSQASALIKADGLENLPGAKFEQSGEPGHYKFTWATKPENSGDYRIGLTATDFANEVPLSLRIKVECADACKAFKAAKAKKLQEERAAAEKAAAEAAAAAAAANGTTPNGTTPNGTTPNGAAPNGQPAPNNGAAPTPAPGSATPPATP